MVATKWNSTAKKKTTSAVLSALSKIEWTGKSRAEIRGVIGVGAPDRSVMTDVFGEVRAEAVNEVNAIAEKYAGLITDANALAILADCAAANARVAALMPETDLRITPAEQSANTAQYQEQSRQWELDRQKRRENMARILAKRPAWAEALIVAELHQDDSEIQSDYFAHSTKRVCAIGWRKGKREDFRQLRAAAGKFPDTAHLGPGCDVHKIVIKQREDSRCGPPLSKSDWAEFTGIADEGHGAAVFTTLELATEAFELLKANKPEMFPHGGYIDTESIEHRENYSMGAGNYLKAGSSHSSGWAVESRHISEDCSDLIEDCL